MDMSQLGLVKLIKSRLNFLRDRQVVLAENIANAPTPGYTPRDLPAGSFAKMVQNQTQGPSIGMRTTRSGHLGGTQTPMTTGGIRPQAAPDTQTKLNGNSVVLEEQMLKVAETRLNYDTAIGIYRKSVMLLKLAAKRP